MQFTFVVDINKFSVDRIGGTDSYLRRLIYVLRRNNHSVKLIRYDKKKKIKNLKNENSIDTFYTFEELYNYINSLDSNVFICYLNVFDRFRFLINRLFFSSKKNVNLILFFYPNSFLKKLIRFLEIFLSDYENVICVSERILKFVKIFKKNAYLIPPIVPEYYTDIGLEKVKNMEIYKKKSLKNALFLGRIDPKKGINEVIKLVKKSDYLKWTISGIFINSDQPQDIIKKLYDLTDVELIIEDRNKFSDEIELKVSNYMKKNDFFFQPYRNLETTLDLPLLILEAQACGCIVLTTLPNQLNSYLKKPSFAFKKFNSNHIYKYIINFKLNKKNKGDIKNMVINIKSNYSEKIVLSKFIGIFNEET